MSQFAFKRTGDEDYPRHLKVLLQGPPKSGKTTFIATAPNVVVAACEAGLASIAHLDIPYVQVDGTDKLQNLLMILRDDTLRVAAAKQLGLPSIDTVAIDTLDAWQEMLKKEILVESRRSAFQQADWGTLKERMASIMKGFVALPMNVIFTVHTSTTMDDEQRMIYAPALQGSIKDEIAGYVDFSLLSFRQRETGRDGVARISYYVKTEGDQKNPHLGNRAAGRLPEIVEPKFATLHTGVFGHIQRAPRVGEPSSSTAAPEIASVDVTVLPAERTAQTSSHQEVTGVTAPPAVNSPAPAEARPTGTPQQDLDAPINTSGVTHLTKLYAEHGLALPEDLKSWTLGKAYQVNRYFMAWKTDKAAGQTTATRDDLVALLEAAEGYAGELNIQLGTDNLKADGRKSAPAPSEGPTGEEIDASRAAQGLPPIYADEVKSEPAQTEEGAVALLQDQLGATVIKHGAAPNATCDVCAEPVDDPDIADLAVIKFKRALCVKDYKAAVKAAKQ